MDTCPRDGTILMDMPDGSYGCPMARCDYVVTTAPTKEVARYADKAMFDAEPIDRNEDGSISPKVYLLNMTPDPLGAIAAACKMYKGEVVRDLSTVTDDERRNYFEQIQKTHLQAPYEFVDFHFMVEGVTRSLTHQMVRQRTAVYAQESLRFAVKPDISDEVALPPSLAGTNYVGVPDEGYDGGELLHKSPETVMRGEWDHALETVNHAYHRLVGLGMPQEDARGLLPHNITTRLHYKTNLRNLLEHAGNRLCTQAQFEWRSLWVQFVQAIREYDTQEVVSGVVDNEPMYMAPMQWQQNVLADLFRPICYLTGKCEFNADFDRACSIRDRVQANHEVGRPSTEWGNELDRVEGNPIVSGVGPQSVVRGAVNEPVFIGAIQPAEWLLDPAAARVR